MPGVSTTGIFMFRKSATALFVLLVSSVLVFLGIRAIPGDPSTVLAGSGAGPAAVAATRHHYLLDRPLYVQYTHWLWLALHGNLGTAAYTGLPVGQTIFSRVPLTLELATLSLLVAVLIGIPTGVIAAARRGKPAEYVATGIALIGLCVPSFWLGLILILWFAVDLHWLPAGGYTTMHHPIANLRHMLLPCIVLGAGFSGLLMRHTRSSMLTSLREDYIRTARAKGVSERRVVWKHAFRASLITIVTVIGLEFGLLFSAAAVTESVFGIPGFGRLGLDAITERDYPLLQGVALLTTAAYVIVSLVIDFVYPRLDPRVGASESRT